MDTVYKGSRTLTSYQHVSSLLILNEYQLTNMLTALTTITTNN